MDYLNRVASDAVPTVSIVVPIYNASAYLALCVESIQHQTLKSLEIVLVDDCSTDDSLTIAEELGRSDARVRVLRRDRNGGLGLTRNAGLEVSTGTYVAFVDADDWIDQSMFESLVALAESERLDACFSGRRIVRHGVSGADEVHPLSGMILTGSSARGFRKELFGALPENVPDSPIPVSAWANLYRRSLLVGSDISFEPILSEDVIFNIRVARAAARLGFSEGVFYNYRKDNQPSITSGVSDIVIERHVVFFEKLMNEVVAEKPEVQPEFTMRASRRVVDYTRALITRIDGSSGPFFVKQRLVRKLLGSSLVNAAARRVPLIGPPVAQSVYNLAIRGRSALLASSMSHIRNWIGVSK